VLLVSAHLVTGIAWLVFSGWVAALTAQGPTWLGIAFYVAALVSGIALASLDLFGGPRVGPGTMLLGSLAGTCFGVLLVVDSSDGFLLGLTIGGGAVIAPVSSVGLMQVWWGYLTFREQRDARRALERRPDFSSGPPRQ
jgi:hypothetical protein